MSGQKLDWMYKGISGLVDREDYLTGRKVDKTFEIIQKEEESGHKLDTGTGSSVPSSLFGIPSSSNVTIDLANKIREDPLYEMKKKQLEESKKILENPLKMKRIKALIESALESDDHSSSSSSRQTKRKKKHKHSRDESSSGDEKRRRKHKHSRKHKTKSNSSDEDRRSRSRHR